MGLLAAYSVVAILAVGEGSKQATRVEQPQNATTSKVDKQAVSKKKLLQAKTAEQSAVKVRVARGIVDSATSFDTALASSPRSLGSPSARLGDIDLMTAANEKKYMLVKKKPKHKKIKMEVFKPKMKYKKIKMKIPVKKMKKKKVKGYLVKKEHGHHEY